jgi:hypothetical protein
MNEKRLVDINISEQKEIIRQSLEEFKEHFQPVLEKYSDIQVSGKELGQIWKGIDGKPIHEQTIWNYSRLPVDPLPKLKNGKYSLKACCEWLYESSFIKETEKGKRLFRQIIKRYETQK